jgi:predicted ArsR family transcriptional regulator
MPVISSRSRFLLSLAARPEGALVTDAADRLAVTRSCAGGYLRRLEAAGLLDAELVDGGRLRYALAERGERVLAA